MSFDVDADPQDLHRMADELRSFATSVDVTQRELAHLFHALEWDDRRYTEFRDQMQPVLSMLSDVVEQAEHARAYVDEKAEILDRYLGGR